MKNFLFFSTLIIFVCLISFIDSFADIGIDIDKHIYFARDTIYLEGVVNFQESKDVLLEIKNSRGELIFSNIIKLEDDKESFDTQITLIGNYWYPDGQFKIFATYGEKSVWVPFYFYQSKNLAPKWIDSEIIFDKSLYPLTGTVTINVISPQLDRDRNKIEYIGNSGDEKIEIKTSKGKLSSYLLEETSEHSGIFNGTIRLTGDKNLDVDKNTRSDAMNGEIWGGGPFDGLLAAFKVDKLEVTFSNKHETVTQSVPISWSIGTIEVVDDFSNGIYKIRVTDPDMNFGNFRADKIVLQNRLELTETGLDTGIFEKLFSQPYRNFPILYNDITVPAEYGPSVLVSYYDEQLLTNPTPEPSEDNPKPPKIVNYPDADVIILEGASLPGCKDITCYEPRRLTIGKESTITWINADSTTHTVTSGTPRGSDEMFDSGLLKSGDSFSATFEKVGTYPYFCKIHSWMTGYIVVARGGATISDSTPFKISKNNIPPKIVTPSDITTNAENQFGSRVAFDVVATDDIDKIVKSSCSKNSGDLFPIGIYTVTCNAIDSSGNRAIPVSFTITVNSATEFPKWVKNIASFWCKGTIEDSSFIEAMQYLINNKLISVSATPGGNQEFPHWLKNNACWWSQDEITDKDFRLGLEFLIKNDQIKLK